MQWGIVALLLMLFGIETGGVSAAGNVTAVQEDTIIRITGDATDNGIQLRFDEALHITPNEGTTVNNTHETLILDLFLGVFIFVNLGDGLDQIETMPGTSRSTYTLAVQVDEELMSTQGITSLETGRHVRGSSVRGHQVWRIPRETGGGSVTMIADSEPTLCERILMSIQRRRDSINRSEFRWNMHNEKCLSVDSPTKQG